MEKEDKGFEELLKSGAAKIAEGDFEGAIKDLDEAIRLDPKNATAWHDRGFAKKELGRYAEEIADYDEAIRLDPKNATAWISRGFCKISTWAP